MKFEGKALAGSGLHAVQFAWDLFLFGAGVGLSLLIASPFAAIGGVTGAVLAAGVAAAGIGISGFALYHLGMEHFDKLKSDIQTVQKGLAHKSKTKARQQTRVIDTNHPSYTISPNASVALEQAAAKKKAAAVQSQKDFARQLERDTRSDKVGNGARSSWLGNLKNFFTKKSPEKQTGQYDKSGDFEGLIEKEMRQKRERLKNTLSSAGKKVMTGASSLLGNKKPSTKTTTETTSEKYTLVERPIAVGNLRTTGKINALKGRE